MVSFSMFRVILEVPVEVGSPSMDGTLGEEESRNLRLEISSGSSSVVDRS